MRVKLSRYELEINKLIPIAMEYADKALSVIKTSDEAHFNKLWDRIYHQQMDYLTEKYEIRKNRRWPKVGE